MTEIIQNTKFTLDYYYTRSTYVYYFTFRSNFFCIIYTRKSYNKCKNKKEKKEMLAGLSN